MNQTRRRRCAKSDDPNAVERREWYESMQAQIFGKKTETAMEGVVKEGEEIDTIDLSDVEMRKGDSKKNVSDAEPKSSTLFKMKTSAFAGSFALELGDESLARLTESRSKKNFDLEEKLEVKVMDNLNHRKWFVCLTSPTELRARLFCFHGVGGNPMWFHYWRSTFLRNGIEMQCICLPGRFTRARERSMSNYSVLNIVTNLLEAMKRCDFINGEQPKTSLFGHGVGALIAYELARELKLQKLPLNVHHLIVSEIVSPKLVSEYYRDWRTLKLHKATVGELVSHMLHLGLVPEHLKERRDLLEAFTVAIRQDYETLETYRLLKDRATAVESLSCPITTIRRSEELNSIIREDVALWAEVSVAGVRRPISLRPEGGSFFSDENSCRIGYSRNETRVFRAVVLACGGLDLGANEEDTEDESDVEA